MPKNLNQIDETTASTSIVLNGQPFELAAPGTIATLIELRQPRPPFAVEHNKRLVRRADYARTVLAQNDCVEIVTLVGGG